MPPITVYETTGSPPTWHALALLFLIKFNPWVGTFTKLTSPSGGICKLPCRPLPAYPPFGSGGGGHVMPRPGRLGSVPGPLKVRGLVLRVEAPTRVRGGYLTMIFIGTRFCKLLQMPKQSVKSSIADDDRLIDYQCPFLPIGSLRPSTPLGGWRAACNLH